ncbi:uncharacterized protein LOC121948018 [Plectropomus leopardus]|uniref:uncharacterized protein LOC121948018 n=1 Tax=Plectropomus leopardus TaxID=160734 RepID=UPI001C4BCC22|nr:uncharacterized protein LOC121948018 [Plectropomus leopardus]
MLLLFGTVFCAWFGSCAGFQTKQVCYGKDFKLPMSYAPPLFDGPLYFTPNGKSTRLMMDKGEAKDPRFRVSVISAVFKDLTERDNGFFSVSHDDDTLHDVIKLVILDCSEEVLWNYGDRFVCSISREAEFLEFIPLHSSNQPTVLWNRTNPQISEEGRGRFKRNRWEILNVNQGDIGHYNVRRKDNTLLFRIYLTVQEHFKQLVATVNEQVFLNHPSVNAPWKITFHPETQLFQKTEFVERGHLKEYHWGSPPWIYERRITVIADGIEIYPVTRADAGRYEFTDMQGHLAMVVELTVDEPDHTLVYVGIGVGTIFAVIVCCCCVRKCCCKNSSSKRDQSAPQTAAAPAPAPTPAVYYHDVNQPGAPSYSAVPAGDYSNQPANSCVPTEPTATSLELSVAPLGGQGADPAPSFCSDFLSSDPVPRFDLKLPSAPPLSSDSISDVYNSDKLNFL